MGEVARPRRSVIYMPGSNRRALEKGKSLPADVFILDLEDAVAPDAKAAAREAVAAALSARTDYGHRELVVRVNALDTPFGHADLAALARSGADAVLLPKVESADMVRRVAGVLERHGAPPDLALWCMMETPRGVLRAEEIADHPRVAALVMGTSDLTSDLHALHTGNRLPILPALAHAVLAARAAGIPILDGVHLDLDDMEGFAASCRQGREFGFDGKTLIHPRQIDAANEAFAPTPEEIARAEEIIAAFEEAARAGKGVVVVGGRLVENLHIVEARRTLAMARAIESHKQP